LKKEKTKYAKTFAALNKDLRRGIENQRKALEQIAFKPVIRTPIPLWTAFDIVEDPGNIPFQSHIEASNNWAVTTFENGTNGDGNVDVYFWFAWQNPSQDFAVLNAESDLVIQGTCRTVAHSYLIIEGVVRLDFFAELVAYTGIAPISGGFVRVGFRQSGWPGDPPVPISGTFHLPGPSGGISVSGGSLVLFAVHFLVHYEVYNGVASYDFESPGFILCPSVQLELLTPPVIVP
jgi:hypothetical protein